MDAKGFGGSVAGIPVRGGIVSINSADAAAIITAASGLIMTTAKVAMVGGLAMGLFALLFNGLKASASSKVPILSLARIKNFSRNILGICTDEFFECTCDGHKLKIPTFAINNIRAYAGFCGYAKNLYGYNISLVDGSYYGNCQPISNQLSFLTICGVQKVDIYSGGNDRRITPDLADRHLDTEIEGATAQDVIDLRQRLTFAFENNLDKIIETIGKERFEKYFVLKG